MQKRPKQNAISDDCHLFSQQTDSDSDFVFTCLQRKGLKQLAESNVVGGSGGEDDMMVNMFDSMTKKLSNEMVILLKHAKKVLFAPTRGHGAARVTGKYTEILSHALFLLKYNLTIRFWLWQSKRKSGRTQKMKSKDRLDRLPMLTPATVVTKSSSSEK